MRQGFSLIELSVVLVIIGLVSGGIIASQSLIRASEMRAVVTEYQRYITAINNFRDKYQAIPGDFDTATTVWGKSSTYCPSDPGTAVANGTCNGNTDGYLNVGATAGSSGEQFQFWKQLALSGMIEGNYTGVAGPNAAIESLRGVNIPASRLPSAAWGVRSTVPVTGDGNLFNADYGMMFEIGLIVNYIPNSPVLNGNEAWNIDTKLDDGLPGKGKVMALFWPTCTNATSAADVNATYKRSDGLMYCSLIFPKIIGAQ